VVVEGCAVQFFDTAKFFLGELGLFGDSFGCETSAERRRLGAHWLEQNNHVAAEYEATQMSTQPLESTDNQLPVAVLKDIADEELGEFLRLLYSVGEVDSPCCSAARELGSDL
jgi:hypothetical protein